MTWRYDAHMEDNAAFLRQFITFLQSCIEQRSSANPGRPEFVPAKVRTMNPIFSDIPGRNAVLVSGVHVVKSNQWGAIAAECGDGQMLGIKPAECIVLEMRPNQHLQRNRGDDNAA